MREMNIVYAKLEEKENYYGKELSLLFLDDNNTHKRENIRRKLDNIYLTIITLGEVMGYTFQDYLAYKEQEEQVLRSSQQVVLDRLYEQLQQRIDFWENAETTSHVYREIRIEEIATTMRVIGEVTDYTYQQSKAALKAVDDEEPIEDIFELIPFN